MPLTTQQTTKKPSDLINEGADALRSALDVVQGTKDPIQAGRDSIDLARTAISAKQNVVALDSKMQKLEGSSPGTLAAVEKTAVLMDTLGELAMPQAAKIPGIDKKALTELKEASTSFKEFAAAYSNYEKTTRDYIPFNEGPAALKAVKEWKEFKQDFDDLEKRLPPSMRSQTSKPAVKQAADAALDVGDAALNALDRLLK